MFLALAGHLVGLIGAESLVPRDGRRRLICYLNLLVSLVRGPQTLELVDRLRDERVRERILRGHPLLCLPLYAFLQKTLMADLNLLGAKSCNLHR